MVRCSYCEVELLPDSEHVICSGCDSHYCFGCSLKETVYRNMTEEKKKAWRCQNKCKGKRDCVSKPNSQKSVDSDLTPNLSQDLDVKAMLQSLMLKVDGFESMLSNISDSQTFISNKYDELLNEIKEVKKQNKSLSDEILGLKRNLADRDIEVEELKEQVNDLDQYGRRVNLEISGLKDAGKRDTMDVLEDLAREIKVPFNKTLIQAAHPLKQYNSDRPPTVLVQFTTKATRDLWIAEGKKTFKTSTEEGEKPAKPLSKIYLNENLTPANRLLYKETRAKSKVKAYSFVWVKNGKILVRKEASAQIIHIRNQKDLDKIV